jgi:hypothetical protein
MSIGDVLPFILEFLWLIVKDHDTAGNERSEKAWFLASECVGFHSIGITIGDGLRVSKRILKIGIPRESRLRPRYSTRWWVQEGQEAWGSQVVQETQLEVLQEKRMVVEAQARQEGQESVALDEVGVVDLRMEVECIQPVVQALEQLQQSEQEVLCTGQGSEEHNLRNYGHSMGRPQMEDTDICQDWFIKG